MKVSGLSENRYIKVMDYVHQETRENGRNFILHNAPVLILLHGPQNRSFASENCQIAAATIIHYAHTLGLGSCLIGIMTLLLKYHAGLRKRLGVPRGRRVYATLVMGDPMYHFVKTVSRKKPEITWLGKEQ